MKISTKGRYALRIMVDIAMHDKEELVSIKEIACRQGISEKYMEQLAAALKKAGYVKSIRGAKGGYRLSMKPEKYTVGMILRAIEGDMAPVACLEGEEQSCEMADSCTTIRLWRMLDDAVKGVIDRVTIEDMLQWEQEKKGRKTCNRID